MNSSNLYDWSFDTLCVQNDGNHRKPLNSHAMPIFQTSSFVFDSPDAGRELFAGEISGHIYSRLGNPTVEALEKSLAVLEVEKGSESHSICFSTGMAAVTGVILSLLECGDHIIVGEVLYGCSLKLVTQQITKFGIEYSTVNTSNVEAVRAAVKPNTKLIFYETPANPTGIISDIAGISKLAHEFSKQRILTCVDSTFASPYNQQPLMLGADIVLHSLTKYLGGHGDVVGGAVITRDHALANKIRGFRAGSGGCLGPFDAFLVLRGIKTLAVRMSRHNANAIAVASFLKSHPLIEDVLFAYFPNFPNHDIAARQMFRHVHKKILHKGFTNDGTTDDSDSDSININSNIRRSSSNNCASLSPLCSPSLCQSNVFSSPTSLSLSPSLVFSRSSSPSSLSSLFSKSSLFPPSFLSSSSSPFVMVDALEGGYGATFSFTMRGGYESAKCLMENLHLATLCVSLGNTDTLIEHPGSMTHAAFTEEQMKAAGFTKNLVRIAVGLEDPGDIIEDLDQGLVAVARMEQGLGQKPREGEIIQGQKEKEKRVVLSVSAPKEEKGDKDKKGRKEKKKKRRKEKKMKKRRKGMSVAGESEGEE